MRLLLIEDDAGLRQALAGGLARQGFSVDAAADGDSGWAIAAEARHDVIVLDRTLPGLDGLELLRRLRRSGSAVPVLLLTARDAVADRVAGLEAGADDYVIKPFAAAELVARLRALARRGRGQAEPQRRLGPLLVDAAARRVQRDGRDLELTAREWDLFALLVAADGAVVTRAEVERRLYPATDDRNVVDVLISRLRRKLHAPGAAEVLHTLRGQGWRLA